MRRRYKILISLAVGLVVAALSVYMLSRGDIPVLNTQGLIANKQRDLIIFTVVLSLFVIVPVFVLLFGIAWKFRASNTKAKYRPDWDHSNLLEAIWWGLPFLIIVVLSWVIWVSSHELDPYRPLDSDKKPIAVQVVALQWKWLFIYPEHGVAAVNEVAFPVDTPVNFKITADAPMNSFWIPSLGGQVYAMNGMSTKLHLMADSIGDYKGSSANISGKGFAGMKFVARAQTEKDFEKWLESAKKSDKTLDENEYNKLAKPTENAPVMTYVLGEPRLYDTIINKYMDHGTHADKNEGHEYGEMSH